MFAWSQYSSHAVCYVKCPIMQAHLHTLIMCTGASSELVFSPVVAGHYLVTVLPLLREPPTLSSLGPETIVGSAAVHVEHVVVVAGESIVAIACLP